MDFLKFTADELNVGDITEAAKDASCGAISLFVGTTRDNFDGKTVVTLEYEAYESMAMKSLQNICAEIREQWPSIANIAIFHRLGTVPVKEASIVIAISSPHRAEAMQATAWCIDSVKKSVPIWKKEVYTNDEPQWKQNVESKMCVPKPKILKFEVKEEVKVPFVSSHLIQVKATTEELDQRIQKFIERKRDEINKSNIRDFCVKRKNDSEDGCARVDAVLVKRKDSKGHLQVNRVLNTYSRDQNNSDYLTKYIPKNGIEERLKNLEVQLGIHKPVPTNIYKRLRLLEDRVLYLEAISPEYVQFWDRNGAAYKPLKKRVFSVEEIDRFITDLEKHKTETK